MAIDWKFNANDVEDPFELVPIGDYRLRIAEASAGKTQRNMDKITLKLDVSGQSSKVFYDLIFFTDNTTRTNTDLKRLWDSFDIPVNNLDYHSWVGKVGAGRVKHDTYNGDTRAKISYFIERSKQDKLPPWMEKSGGTAAAPAPAAAQAPFAVDDLPL